MTDSRQISEKVDISECQKNVDNVRYENHFIIEVIQLKLRNRKFPLYVLKCDTAINFVFLIHFL